MFGQRGTGAGQLFAPNQPVARSLRLLFEPLEVADQIADLTRIQSEFGHIRVTGDNALTERLFK